MNALLIVGTSPQTGKTVLTSSLAAYWQTYLPKQRLGILKLVQTGGTDRELYHQHFVPDQSLDEIAPIAFETALVPPIAAEREGRSIRLETVWQQLQSGLRQKDWILIEGYGGLGSPITHETTVADLAWDWRLPTILVVPVEPGTIAQAVANVALAKRSRVHLKGIVLNCLRPYTEQEIGDLAPVSLIQSLTQTPVLGCIPYLADSLDRAKLAQTAANLSLESLMPIPIRF